MSINNNIPQPEHLQMALDIAQAASCFDDLQSAPLGGVVWHESMAAAKEYIAKLHDIAIKLAGEQVDDVYCPDDAVKEAVAA